MSNPLIKRPVIGKYQGNAERLGRFREGWSPETKLHREALFHDCRKMRHGDVEDDAPTGMGVVERLEVDCKDAVRYLVEDDPSFLQRDRNGVRVKRVLGRRKGLAVRGGGRFPLSFVAPPLRGGAANPPLSLLARDL